MNRPSIVRVTRVPMYVHTGRPWVVHTLDGWSGVVMVRPPARTFSTVEEARAHALRLADRYRRALEKCPWKPGGLVIGGVGPGRSYGGQKLAGPPEGHIKVNLNVPANRPSGLDTKSMIDRLLRGAS